MPNRMGTIGVILIALSILLTACGAGGPAAPDPSAPPAAPPATTTPPADSAAEPDPLTEEEHLAEVAAITVQALKHHDLIGLGKVVHPEQGVRFSPYGHVAVDGDYPHVVLTRDDLIAPGALEVERTWGLYDGSGEPIVLTTAEFIDKFLYNKDYAATPEIVWNEVIGTGNIILNHQDAYPDSVFVEYYVPGTDEYAGMDWGSLRIVFAKYDDVWLVVGIIHDQWTI